MIERLVDGLLQWGVGTLGALGLAFAGFFTVATLYLGLMKYF